MDIFALGVHDNMSRYNTKLYNDTRYGQSSTAYLLSLTDSDTLTDLITKAIAQVKADTIAPTDTIAFLSQFYRTFSDNDTLTDAYNLLVSLIPTDSLTVTDTFTTLTFFALLLSDSASLADTFARIVQFYVLFDESQLGSGNMPVTDYPGDFTSAFKKEVFKRSFDSVSIAETLGRLYDLSFFESIASNDHSLSNIETTARLFESMNLSEDDTKLIVHTIYNLVDNTVDLGENKTLAIFLQKLEQVALNESLHLAVNGIHVLLEALTLDEKFSAVSVRNFLDFLFISDFIDIRLPTLGFHEIVQIGEWLEIKFNEPTHWIPPSVTPNSWTTPPADLANWGKPTSDSASFTKPGEPPATWETPQDDLIDDPATSQEPQTWTKPAPTTDPWVKPSKDTGGWTKPTGKTDNFTKPTPNNPNWSQ